MPIPRRFDRRMPERDTTPVNDLIRAPEVRLIGEDGQQIGVIPRDEALAYAEERDLDLVAVAADAKPPVCRVLDYSKYKYEQEQKLKAARKHQQQVTVREIKLRPKIASHDYETKRGHVVRFLRDGSKVKITIMFRGREQAHPERGEVLLMRLAEELTDLANVEQRPIQDGRNMTMMLGPTKDAQDAELREYEPKAPPSPPPPRPVQAVPAAEEEAPAEAGEEPAAEAAAEPSEEPSQEPSEEPAKT